MIEIPVAPEFSVAGWIRSRMDDLNRIRLAGLTEAKYTQFWYQIRGNDFLTKVDYLGEFTTWVNGELALKGNLSEQSPVPPYPASRAAVPDL